MANAEPDHVERRLAAILAADVAGYSRLMGADEEGTLARLKDHLHQVFYPKVTEHRGRVVKTTGDGILVEFGSIIDAVRCAVEVQRSMAARNQEAAANQRMEFRIGINVGDIIIDGDDIYGDGVNVAARLEALAEPGGICVSRTVREQVRNRLDFGFEDLGAKNVKNIAEPIHVDRILISGIAPARSPEPARPRTSFRRGRIGRTLFSAFRLLRVVLVLVLVLIVVYRWVMPPMTPLMLVRYIETGKLDRRSVPLSAISSELAHAMIAGQDTRFCQHSGGSWAADAAGRPGFLGDSESITMRLAGDLFLWPGDGAVLRTIELGLAYIIELAWSKQRIMEVYLNVAAWGPDVFGADAAARVSFGKSARNLSRHEAAVLVTVLAEPAPSRPNRSSASRADRIVTAMNAGQLDYGCLR